MDQQNETPAPVKINRPEAGLNITVDKIDEITTFLMNARGHEAYNPNVPFTVVPNSMEALNLESYMPHPSRIRADINFTSAASFIGYFNEYRAHHKPKIFSAQDGSGLKVRAIIDYHESGEADGVLPLPRWGSHIINFNLTFAPDYKELRAKSGVWMPQREFALFIEQNLHLFTKPTGAEMLELAQTLRGTKNVIWENGKRLSNGAQQIQFIEDVKANTRDNLEVPQELEMIVQMYEGGGAVPIKAAFSYDIGDDRKLQLQFRLMTKLEERQAQEEVLALIEQGTETAALRVSSFPAV